MLAFANQMFLDVLHEDGLVIAAKGLGLEEVFFNLLKVYSDPGNLVLVMGTSDEEEEYFINRLEKSDVKAAPKKVTTEFSIADRGRLYLNGGVLFITTRILVVDMLTDRIPMHLITGLLMYKAHKIVSSCQEAFIMRLFRSKNKTGFIKAFSGSPISFTAGFCQVSRVMRSLFVRNLYLWPRFHSNVVESLKESTTPEVIELHVDMTQSMQTIQTSILDLMSFTLQELKRINPSLNATVDDEEDRLTVENAISKSFHKTLQAELDPVWHQLSWKTKQLVSDMKTLRSILMHLTNYDCITFYTFVSALRTTEAAIKSGGWMILDSAESLFITAKSRVFGPESGKSEAKKPKFDFEECPKWKVLKEIIEEIKTEVKENEDIFPSAKILVLAADERVSQQLQDLLVIGSESLMQRMFNKCLGEKYGLSDESKKEPKDKGKGKKSTNNAEVDPIPESPMTIIQSSNIGNFAISRLIDELKPRYIILYDCRDIGIVRQIEIFQASNPDFKIKVFFMIYGKSVEEQAYLSSLRQEKEAFEKLIKEKGTMVIPEDREGRTSTNPDLARGSQKASDEGLAMSNAVSRKQGQVLTVQPKVIVDMREFRSELPSLLHKRGIDIEPVTIEVGDYILTPDICVERKSISDLIGSLNNGRLFNQATSMTRFYSRPMLLIEFDQSKPFALQGKYYLSRDIGSSDLVARLQLLTIHFPKLRILWSPSPHATAELFEELKRGREQPDASKAAAISIDVVDDFNAGEDKYNPAVKDFIAKLPGINTRNMFAILNRVESLGQLLELDEQDLEEILGSKSNAQDLHQSLHGKLKSSQIVEEKNKKTGKSSGAAGKSRFKSIKK